MNLNLNCEITVLFDNTQALLVLNIHNWQNIFTSQIRTQTNPLSKWRLHTSLLNSEFKKIKLITTTNINIIIITFVIINIDNIIMMYQELATKLESTPSELFTRLFPDIQDCTVEKVRLILLKLQSRKNIFVFMIQDDLLIIAGTSSPIRTAKFQPGRRWGREAGGTGWHFSVILSLL